MSEPLTYINGTCQIGQREACGKPAAYAIAVRTVADTAWGTNPRDGGIVLLCRDHSRAVADWPTPADLAHDTGQGGE